MATATKKITLDVYNNAGKKVSQRELSGDVFDVPLQEGLVHFAVVAQQANARHVLAHTKSRGEVRGGGKKPWKQKGTGRARHGSIRSPLWRGGGVSFGPRSNRNYSLKINKKVKQKALCMVLSQKAHAGNIILLDTFTIDTPRTKEMVTLFKNLPITSTKKKTEKIAFVSPLGATVMNKSLRNIPFVNIVPAHSMNIVDILNSGKIVMPLSSVDMIEKMYAKKV